MRKPEEIKATANIKVLAGDDYGFMGEYFDSTTRKWLTFIFSWGGGWEHLSVSTPNKLPTWEQMCKLKEIFWEDEEACVEYHPRKSEYVNNHRYCLHIWRPINEELPTPPEWMVGIKELGEL
jgi:hypothetical protein